MPVIAVFCILGAGLAAAFPKTSIVLLLLASTFVGAKSLPRTRPAGQAADLAKSVYVAQSSTPSESWSYSDSAS